MRVGSKYTREWTRPAAVAKQREAIANGEELKDEITLDELYQRFITQKDMKNEANTTKRYRSLYKLYLGPRFGDKKARALKPHHLTDAYAEWMEKGRDGRRISAKTVRHAHDLLRNILNWGVRRELLTRNVAALVADEDLPKATKPEPKALTAPELTRLLQESKNPTQRSKKRGYLSAQRWFYPAVAFVAYTGTRRGEVLALRWSDVDLETKTVTIARSLTEDMRFKAPKNDKARHIKVDATLCSILEAHRTVQAEERRALGTAYKDQDLVFAHADGTPVKPWNFARAVSDCIKRSGVSPITLHGLRDTHASLLASMNVPIEVVSKRLGHSGIQVTVERYLHVYKERDADAAAAFERLVG